MKRKKLFISLTVILSFFIALSIFLGVWFYADKYESFDKNFSKEFAIPGLKDGAVPQGMGNCELSNVKDKDGNVISAKQQYFFITAYMVDGSPSRIYVTGGDTGYIGYVTMKNVDGTDYTGHCGGIAMNSNGSIVWVTGESTVYVAKSSDNKDNDYTVTANEIIDKALGKVTGEDGEIDRAVKFTAQFDANCNADFCYYYNDPKYSNRLFVGEFYRKGNYETDASHRLTTPNGYKNTAFAYEYAINTGNKYGLTPLSESSLNEENQVPRIYSIYSIPEKVQGFAIAGDNIVLSQSYGLSNSHITVYDKTKVTASKTTFEHFEYAGIKQISGAGYYADITMYTVDYNDKDMLKQDYSIPSMSEGLCTVVSANSAKVYVLFESAGKKYNLFVREQLPDVYSIRIKN